MTATLSGSDLQITLGAADDVAYLSNNGTNYIVRGTGLSGYAAANASVDSVSVVGTAAANQAFTVAAGVGAVLTDSLSVAASVESTTVVGAIDTAGTVTIGSASITLAADVTTTGNQNYQGNVGIVGDRTLSSGVGDVSFGGTVNSSPTLFADPDAFASGTVLTSSFPGIALSAVGTSQAGLSVQSTLSSVSTPTTGSYAPTGNRLFGGGSSSEWNDPGQIFKASFAAPATSVSLDFAANDAFDSNAYLEAYDSSGDLVAEAFYPEAIPERVSLTLTVSAPDIAFIKASFDPGGANAGLLDNLRVTLANKTFYTLTVNSSGKTTFGGAVGGGTALTSLTTDAGGTSSLKSVTTTGTQTYSDATVTLDGVYATSDSAFTVANAAILAGSTTVNTGAGAGAISFGSTLDGTAGGSVEDLSLTAGTGNVTFTGAVGGSARLGAITITSATDVTTAAIKATSLTQTAGSGTTTLNGAVDTNGVAGVSLTGTNLAVNASITTTSGGAVTFSNKTGTITIAAAADISADGEVSMTGGGGITTAGDVTTTNDPITFSSATTLSGNVAVNTAAGVGDITFAGKLDGAKQATLAAGTGAVSFKAAVGSNTPLAGITLTSAASTTAESTVKLVKAADSGQDGLTVAAGVNNVKMTSAGSSVTGFTRNGISFLGGSTDSRLSGFTVSGNGGNGMSFAAGSYAGTTLTANTISDNGDKTAHVGDGILVQGSGLMIGWDASPAGNTAANTINNNALNGIRVDGVAAINNTVLSNSIYLNGYVSSSLVVGDGIALTNGGNGDQTAPRILDIVRDANENKVRVQLIVDASGSYLVQLFRNTAADERSIFPTDANGFEGRSLVGESPVSVVTPVTTGKPVIDGTPVITGNTLQTIEIDASLLDAGDWLTATATRLAGTIPTNTSSFSAGVQVLRAPVLAIGGDGQSAMWDREFAYTATNSATLQISGLTAAQAAFFSRGTQLTITAAGAATTNMATVVANTFNQRTARATIKLSGAIPVGSGTLVLGLPSSLPAARLVNASNTQVELPVGNLEISAALAGVPGLTAAQRNAFVTRFQGGLRVAAGDFDGDGYTDLVTAPGGVPANLQPSLRNVFGSAGRVITIYNGAPASPTPAWSSASIDVGAVFGSTYLGGFLVTVGNVTTENSGSGNAVVELIVASTGKVAVFDVTVPARGAKPVIGPSPTRSENVAGTITGLASGTFSNPVTGFADIVVAATTATSKTPVNAGDTTSVSLFQPAGGVSSFKINSLVWSGDPKRSASRQVNVFLNGASLAVGDIDNQIDQKPELILGAGAAGLGNFRVLAGSVVQSASQAAVDSALSTGGQYSRPTRGVNSVTKYWQPTGGPDYFVGVPNENVPTPIGSGFNAPLSLAVVESNGKNFRAELFAAIGAANQTPNQIRSFQWNSSTWSGQDWFAVPEDGNRLRKGSGLRLG